MQQPQLQQQRQLRQRPQPQQQHRRRPSQPQQQRHCARQGGIQSIAATKKVVRSVPKTWANMLFNQKANTPPNGDVSSVNHSHQVKVVKRSEQRSIVSLQGTSTSSVLPKPISTKPVSTKPISTKPISTKPISKKPISKKPISKKPISTKSGQDQSQSNVKRNV